MKPRLHALQGLGRISRPLAAPSIVRPCSVSRFPAKRSYEAIQLRHFAFSTRVGLQEKNQYDYSSPNARPAEELNNNVTKEEEQDYDQRLKRETKERQIRAPWNREGSDVPPVARQRSAGAMTKGKPH